MMSWFKVGNTIIMWYHVLLKSKPVDYDIQQGI